MKTQGWSHEINQRGSGLEMDAGKVAVAREISVAKMMLHVAPVTCRLQSQMNVLADL